MRILVEEVQLFCDQDSIMLSMDGTFLIEDLEESLFKFFVVMLQVCSMSFLGAF